MSKATKKSILFALGVLVLIAFAMWLRYASRHIFHSPAVSQPPAKRDLCVFVQRVVLLPADPHRADTGAALSGGDLGADGALDSSALNQIFH